MPTWYLATPQEGGAFGGTKLKVHVLYRRDPGVKSWVAVDEDMSFAVAGVVELYVMLWWETS